jgi:hypothetical protein
MFCLFGGTMPKFGTTEAEQPRGGAPPGGRNVGPPHLNLITTELAPELVRVTCGELGQDQFRVGTPRRRQGSSRGRGWHGSRPQSGSAATRAVLEHRSRAAMLEQEVGAP